MTDLFKGMSGFPVTPTDGNGTVATDRLAKLVDRVAQVGAGPVGVLGSTGGYAYLSGSERARALRAAVEAAGTTPVIAGIGALAQHDVLDHARAAEAAGAAGVLIAPMSYLPLTEDEVAGLVTAIAGVTGLPILLYNNPGTTNFTFSDALTARLSFLPRVQAIKNPAPTDGDFAGHLARLRMSCGTGFSLGYSGDATIAGALSAGCDAWYSVLGGTLPDLCAAMWAARQDAPRLADLDARLAPMWDLFRAHGGIRIVHTMVELMGLGPAPLPKPLLPFGTATTDQIAAAMDAALQAEAA